MIVDNSSFAEWMEKLSQKLDIIGKDLKTIINTNDVFDDNDKILDNQDLAFLLKVSIRTLQRYRDSNSLPFFKIEGKVYYKASDIRAFVKKHCDVQTLRRYEKENPEGETTI